MLSPEPGKKRVVFLQVAVKYWGVTWKLNGNWNA